MNFRIARAVFKKDLLSLAPLVALIALLFLGDTLIVRLELLPEYPKYNTPLLLVALVVLVLSVFQLDSPASLTHDWLCRPIRSRELLAAKFALLVASVFLPRAAGVLIADLSLGFPLAESMLDALLLQDKLLLFALPIVLLTAIVTRTFIQGFGVLFAICIAVFVIPTPFVRPPGPLTPGIREDLYFTGMQWLATTPAKLVALTLVAAGFWLVYRRRRLVAARALLALAVCSSVLLLVLPMAVVPWTTTFAVQQASAAAPAIDASRLNLRNTRQCFPATRRSRLAADASFVAATQEIGLWDEEALRDVGPEAIAFLTRIEPRGLPLDWRAKLNYVQADYFAGGARLYALRPARYITDRSGGDTLIHAWMLPEGAVHRLRDAAPRLKLTYSLTLLKPREYQLPTDGSRRVLPGLGSCSARADVSGDHIDVDCFSAFSHAAQISAELNGIPASRDYGPVDFSPRWVQWPYGRRVKLAIGSPRLARHDTITVTAWQAAGHVAKSLEVPGMLGADSATCPLPTRDGGGFRQSRWRDNAPHEVNTIAVDDGVALEVLDFGGSGSPVVLLPGLGATAHAYDELAPLLAARHRVIAITRRGAGLSSRPDWGFDTARLGKDVLAVMNDLALQKVLLVGHSIAGEELTWLGGHHAERFSGLVYLDAAYDRSGDHEDARSARVRELNRTLPPEPPVPPAALLNYQAMSRLLEERGRTSYPEGELIAFFNIDKPHLAGTPNTDARTQQAISAAIVAPDYRAVGIPALAIYAVEQPDKPPPPWFDFGDDQALANLAELRRLRDAMRRENMDSFRRDMARGQVLALHGATHYVMQSNLRDVHDAIETFAAGTAR